MIITYNEGNLPKMIYIPTEMPWKLEVVPSEFVEEDCGTGYALLLNCGDTMKEVVLMSEDVIVKSNEINKVRRDNNPLISQPKASISDREIIESFAAVIGFATNDVLATEKEGDMYLNLGQIILEVMNAMFTEIIASE